MPNILLAGQDVRLLDTRAAVLRRTGADVSCCTASQAVGRVMTEKPDLVVLCHSLLGGEAELIADEIRKCCKGAKILLVLSAAGADSPLQDSKFDAMCFSNPERLITAVGEALGETLPHRPQMIEGDAAHESSSDYQM